MSYGQYVAKPYLAGGSPTDALSAVDLARASVGGLVPMVQEVTHEITAIADAVRQVTTAGTRVRLAASSTPCRLVVIQALPTNVSGIAVGASTVVAALGTQASPTLRGIAYLLPREAVAIAFNDATNLWLDAITSADGALWGHLD